MRNGFSFLFLGTIGWGISLCLIKILLHSLSPLEIVLYRMLIGAVTLILLVILMRISIKNWSQLVLDGTVLGLLNMAIPIYLTAHAEQNVSSALASIVNGLTPLFTFLLGIVVFGSKQKINIVIVFSIILGLLGIILVNTNFNISHDNLWDLIDLLAVSASYGLAANYVKFWAKTKEPILIAAMGAVVSTILLFFTKIIYESGAIWNLPHTVNEWTALFWLGCVGSGLCLYLYCFLIKNTGALYASMITYLMTVTGVLVGVALLNETMSLLSWVGCGCIVVSLILTNHSTQLWFFVKRAYGYRGL